MLPRTDINIVHPVGHVEGPHTLEALGDARQQAFQRTMQGLLGKEILASVTARLNDGSFVVRLPGTSARMLLPPDTQVGQDVPLTLLSLNPRPTFQIGNQTRAGISALPYTQADASAPAALPQAPNAGQRTTQAGLAARSARQASPIFAQTRSVPDSMVDPVTVPRDDGATRAARPTPTLGNAAAGQSATGSAAVQTAARAVPSAPATPAYVTPGTHTAAQTAAHARAATLLSAAPIIASNLLPEIDPGSTPPALSEIAKAIAAVLSPVAGRSAPPQPIHGHTPLVGAPDVGPDKLARALDSAISKSGLFYESHVAEWAVGQRALSDLTQEPQMQLRLQDAAPDALSGMRHAVLDGTISQIVNQQLHTQEHDKVQWQGQVWPGQTIDWEIERDAPRKRAPDQSEQDAASPWRSALRCHFPLLGDVSARLVLVGNELRITLQADSSDTRATLRSHAAQLETAMAAAGAALTSLSIGLDPGRTDGR